MIATLLKPAVQAAEQATRRRMQLAEGGPFLVSDRAAGIALHWLVDEQQLRTLTVACGLVAGAIPHALTPDLIDGHALVSLVVYRATATRVAVGDRFAPWAVLHTPGGSTWVAELRLAAEYTPHDESPEPCYITLALLSDDAASAWVRPDKFAIACNRAHVALELSLESIQLQITEPGDGSRSLDFSAKPTRGEDATWADIPDAVGVSAEPPHEAGALLFARHMLDRLAMFTSARGLVRRASLWRRPQPTHSLEGIVLDVASPPAVLAPLSSARFLGAHRCDAVDGVWIGRPQCVAGPACSLAWREL